MTFNYCMTKLHNLYIKLSCIRFNASLASCCDLEDCIVKMFMQ